MHIRALTIAVALCCATSSLAQTSTEGSACVAKLSIDGQLIFDTVHPELTPTTALQTLVRAKAIELVGAGKVTQASAPDAALAAAECLVLLGFRK
jgi:hypothetical protein